MSILTVYDDQSAKVEKTTNDFIEIADTLQATGVLFERWVTEKKFANDTAQEEIIEAYKKEIGRLNETFGFQSIDVISLHPEHPQKTELRAKFLDEHTHSDFEVRFFVDGNGLFYIHQDGKIFALLCEKGDLISVPAKTPHWFDMGTSPSFKCIRLFTVAEGWIGNPTGSKISTNFPDYDSFTAQYR